ncbi:uncharacterized protein N7469_010777 [Penicillium citrinum]|uniref:Uncharacterized protein n=2 Tax=Penicillium TaxID=5073 RepID=A0A9W9NL08_PENCI|nr:uncharacterized protein N7469_010777 [Penicillium citrinum]KAJ5221890.1 hypothetical protein N7469_010777 [Penicillium citrinum]KAJ5596861.1 hypothetical protein N7450_003319 [Penicillium hetheringtonii]
MKFSAVFLASLAASVTAFDKWQPWGKRDYSCINVFQGIPDHAAVKEGQTVHLRFDRQPTVHCSDPLAKYPAGEYSVWLYNNPVRDRDNIKYDKQIKIASGISAKANSVDIKIPANIPKVNNKDVWYLRLDTTLVSAPQMPSIYNAAGPFTIHDA